MRRTGRNREYHEAPQASETTIFLTDGVAGSFIKYLQNKNQCAILKMPNIIEYFLIRGISVCIFINYDKNAWALFLHILLLRIVLEIMFGDS